MGLSTEEIRNAITRNVNRGTINRAVLQQQRLRFHAQTTLWDTMTQPVADFLAFVSNLIPDDKFKVFKTLFRFPLKTNEITSVCFDKLSRIFEGRNPAFEYQFRSPEAAEDWEEYREKELGGRSVWSSKGWEQFKTEINSVLVVDLPSEQADGDRYPRPYFFWLAIEAVLAYRAEPDGRMRWIAYRQGDERIAVLDDERYRLYSNKSGNIGELLIDNPHDLGYCPAHFFWHEPLSLKDPDIKASPLTRQLESLDWYLFYHLSKRNLDMYGAYPIYSGYEQACDFSNAENGDYCDGGFLKDRKGNYRFDGNGLLMRCPKCGDKRIIGVGSFVEIPVPNGDSQPDLRNPVQMLTVDRESLDYNVAEEERLRTDIITAVVGTNEQITTRDALNEQQIRANFESQTTILFRVKKGFELAQKFVDETVCRLRYGSAFISASIDYGTEFFIYDPNELRERYNTARDSGASETELDALQEQITASEYRNNPIQQRRIALLEELEPYKHLTRAEVVSLYRDGIATAEELRVKLNFPAYVRRFERENTDITEFGSALPLQRKIEIISERLKEYARESLNLDTNNDKNK